VKGCQAQMTSFVADGEVRIMVKALWLFYDLKGAHRDPAQSFLAG